MNSTLLVFFALFLFSLIAIIAIATPLSNKFVQTRKISIFFHPFIYIFTIYAIGSAVAFYFNDNLDFIVDLTPTRAFLPLIFAGLIFLVSLSGDKLSSYIAIIGSVAGLVYLQPLGVGFPFPDIPVWLAKLIMIIVFSIFCLNFKIINILPHTLLIPSITILSGIVLLGVLGGIPIYVMLCAGVLTAILLGFLSINFYNIKLEFDIPSCNTLAFLITNLCLLSASELSFMSCFIFTMIFWVELSMAIYNRYFINHSGSLVNSTNFFVASENRSLYALSLNIAKLSALCVFLGWFQLFSVNQYSLLIVSFLIILWLDNSLANNVNNRIKLKDANKEFIDSVKQNIDEVKESLNHIRNRKDN